MMTSATFCFLEILWFFAFYQKLNIQWSKEEKKAELTTISGLLIGWFFDLHEKNDFMDMTTDIPANTFSNHH